MLRLHAHRMRPTCTHIRTLSNISTVPQQLDEQNNPDYIPNRFYPARVGETLNARFQLVSKLGWGTGSTVWLAQNTRKWPWQSKYLTLKITNCFESDRASAREELRISEHIQNLRSNHIGYHYPLREPLWRLARHLGRKGLPPRLLKSFLRSVLTGLDFLHTECNLIHTDLKAENILLAFEDSSVIDDYVHQQRASPAPYKELPCGQRIYQSQPDFGLLRKGVGRINICDFGHAAFGNKTTPNNHLIQPEQFRAPEVIIGAHWSYSADIWNFGMMLWELLEDKVIVDGLKPETKQYSPEAHFGQLIALLGPPPRSLLDRAHKPVYDHLFTQTGDFRYPHLVPSSEMLSFENKTPFLQGEDKRLFIQCAKRCLAWLPEERPTAKQLFDDPWIIFGLEEFLQPK